MKQLVHDLAKEIPEIRNSMLGAIKNIHPRELLDLKLLSHDEKRSHPST
jgi:tRNA 2-thiocytidine biosynthesis protein TtcA